MGVKLGLSTEEETIDRITENRVLRRIIRSNRGEESVVWRKLHNEELLNRLMSSEIGTNIFNATPMVQFSVLIS
jgi:hypothetical protein